jgi:hypothetical protein
MHDNTAQSANPQVLESSRARNVIQPHTSRGNCRQQGWTTPTGDRKIHGVESAVLVEAGTHNPRPSRKVCPTPLLSTTGAKERHAPSHCRVASQAAGPRGVGELGNTPATATLRQSPPRPPAPSDAPGCAVAFCRLRPSPQCRMPARALPCWRPSSDAWHAALTMASRPLAPPSPQYHSKRLSMTFADIVWWWSAAVCKRCKLADMACSLYRMSTKVDEHVDELSNIAIVSLAIAILQ